MPFATPTFRVVRLFRARITSLFARFLELLHISMRTQIRSFHDRFLSAQGYTLAYFSMRDSLRCKQPSPVTSLVLFPIPRISTLDSSTSSAPTLVASDNILLFTRLSTTIYKVDKSFTPRPRHVAVENSFFLFISACPFYESKALVA
jgi:hypothetical protein